MSGAIAWTIVIPLAAAIVASASGERMARWISALAALAIMAAVASVAWSLVSRGPLQHVVAGWAPPLGIALRADGLAVVMLVIIALVGNIVTALVISGDGRRALPGSRFLSLLLFAWAALDALVLSGDIFNLYVTLELATLAAVGLVAVGGDRPAVNAALRYLLMALPGSLLYLLGVALVYGLHATLDLRLLAGHMDTTTDAVALWLMIAGLLLKAAVFPVHAWLLPAYANALPLAGGVLAALIGKGAFYILLRLWLDTMPERVTMTIGPALGVLAGAAILWGALQATWQQRIRMVIAYSSVAHTGYFFMCFAIGTEEAWKGSVYVAISHAAAVAAMFVASGTITRALGHDRVHGLTGLAHRLPITFFAMTLAGTSLMGMPPSGGFIGKWLLVRAALERGQWWWAAIMLLGGLLAAAYTFRLLRGAFLPFPEGEQLRGASRTEQLAALALALIAIVLGVVTRLPLELLGARSAT
jgi:formate hydrogenlyase subunit 3/multisubunit Na+/H+ antiporter MnhD subunit